MTTENQQSEATQQTSSTPTQVAPQVQVVAKPVAILPIVSRGDLIQLNEGVDTSPTVPNLTTKCEE